MENIEGLSGGETQFEVGDRRGDTNEQIESYFDENLDAAIVALKGKECFAVIDTINRMDSNKEATKERLFEALNQNGLEWKSLDTYTPDKNTGDMLNDAIVSWAEEVELTHGDSVAIRAAGKAFADKLERF
jgi:hypothetical protein